MTKSYGQSLNSVRIMTRTTFHWVCRLVLILIAQVSLGNDVDVPAFRPSWRGMAGTTIEKWGFTSAPTNGSGEFTYYGPEVTLPEVVTNANGTPTASIIAQHTGVGWIYGDSNSLLQYSTTNYGWWDLGFNGGGSITLSIPTAGGAVSSVRYIYLQITEAISAGFFEPATVAVPGGTQVGSTQSTAIEVYDPSGSSPLDTVTVFQSVWQVPGNAVSYTVTITGATTGGKDSIIGGIVVDTSGHPPVANNVTYSRATNLTWKIKSSDLATNGTPGDTGDTLSVVAVSGATHGTVALINSGTYVGYTPVPLNQGLPDTFTYTVQDDQNGLQASALVTLNIVPQQAAQALAIANNGGQITVTFAGIPGYTYDVQRADNVGFSNFTVVETTNTPPGGVFIYVDPSPPQPTAYYRLKQH
jgi:hypothetical protein